MRVMVLVKADESSEAGVMPSSALIAAMMAFNEELAKAGVMVTGDGLRPSSAGVRVRFSGDSRTVVEGPFAATRELVAGFWIWEVKDMAEAIAWARRCPNPQLGESDLEIRPFYTSEDFAGVMDSKVAEQAARVDATIAERHGKPG